MVSSPAYFNKLCPICCFILTSLLRKTNFKNTMTLFQNGGNGLGVYSLIRNLEHNKSMIIISENIYIRQISRVL